ncbi:ComF family protein [Priestia flexa]|uniref:ComF family protein n=1 Tax=Priestia flexa TaxID=86664 RepID=UPI000C23BD04|nr:ComF family protein [Priestia flexa]MEC0665103.1 ComF family protein [Priestia flexa]MED3824453.1 ComF family protein [Priestia flexa]
MTWCLLCHESIQSAHSFSSLISPQQKKMLCETCQSSFKGLSEPLCKRCGRMLNELPIAYYEGEYCIDCVQWKKKKSPLIRNYSLYKYNNFSKELMALFKYRGDYEFHKAFTVDFARLYKLYSPENPVLVPIPLSDERMYERGFNQAEALASLLPAEVAYPLTRKHTEKQAKKTREERLQNHRVFELVDPELVTNRNVILIDDLYTTGVTLHEAALCLKDVAAAIYSFTIYR